MQKIFILIQISSFYYTIYKDISFFLFYVLFYFLLFVTYPNSFSGGFCHDESFDEYDMSMQGNFATNATKSNLITIFYFIISLLNIYHLHKTVHIVILNDSEYFAQ
jgi:hypothetical protein